MSKGTLTVRNVAQKILFTEELAGQLSDGQWENTMPYGHWEPWADAKVVVGDAVGRDFYVSRDRYNLVNKEFLNGLEERMLGYVRLALVYGETAPLQDLEYGARHDLWSEGYKGVAGWNKARTTLMAYDMDRVREVVDSDVLYDRAQLVRDLKDLKAIMRTDKTKVAA